MWYPLKDSLKVKGNISFVDKFNQQTNIAAFDEYTVQLIPLLFVAKIF